MTAPTSAPPETTEAARGRVCTIRSRSLARLAGVLLAVSLNSALGCGHYHTPDCTCS